MRDLSPTQRARSPKLFTTTNTPHILRSGPDGF
jgi:hypothetical protein